MSRGHAAADARVVVIGLVEWFIFQAIRTRLVMAAAAAAAAAAGVNWLLVSYQAGGARREGPGPGPSSATGHHPIHTAFKIYGCINDSILRSCLKWYEAKTCQSWNLLGR